MSDGEEKGGWWGNWVKSAKDKSLSALNMVKKDLAEFSSVMHDDTVKAASKVKEKLTQENANAATEKVKQGVSSFLGGISKALVIEPDDNYQPAQIVGGEAIVFDRYKARLHALQIDPATYTTEPTSDSYQQWLMETNLDSMKGDISDLLVSNVEVRALYTQLVPCSVSNVDFWKRYYFRRHLLEEEEARRLELMKRAEDTKEQKDLGWDEDDDDWTEARTISSGPIEGDDTKLTTAVVETKVNAEEGFTTVQLSSGILEEKVIDPVENSRISDTNPSAASVEVHETTADVLTKPNTESDLETISRADTSSSNFSEELLAPPSDNSVNSIAVLTVSDAQSLESRHSSEPSLSGWSGLSDAKSSEEDSTKMATLEKLEVDEHLQDRKSPSDDTSNAKESLDDEWEKDFDVEVTEEDLAAAQKYLKNDEVKRTEDAEGGPEDWEDW